MNNCVHYFYSAFSYTYTIDPDRKSVQLCLSFVFNTFVVDHDRKRIRWLRSLNL